MNRLMLASGAVALVASSGVWLACTTNGTVTRTADGGPTLTDGAAGDAGDAASTAVFALGIACGDDAGSIYSDPGDVSALSNGDIIRCTQDPDVSMSDLQATAVAALSEDDPPAQNIGYQGKPFTSGAHVYRILYRTERGDSASSPGYSSAKVMIPDTPRAAGKLPLLVGSHGTWGQGGGCAASTGKTSVWVTGDYESLAFPMVGGGLPIILPDLPGYANYGAANNPPSAYGQYLDVGRATLDGARALAKMFPNAFSGKVALVGHSQGGQTTFSALAIQAQYAPELKIAAVAQYAPLWLSQRSWGALLYEAYSYPLVLDPTANAVSIWYHYTHGELLDGPGHGLDVFQASQAAVIKNFVNQDCDAMGWDGSDAGSEYPDLQAVAQTALDLFDPNFVQSIKGPAATGAACATGDAVCAKWIQRYTEDRPSLSGINVPTLIEYGEWDDTIPPDRITCATETLQAQGYPYTFCLNLGVGHEGVLRQQGSYVADWVASQTMGEAAPAPCALTDVNLLQNEAGVIAPGDDGGMPITCLTPPPNN
jgi:pimeloyl-ACP methyl ester carboxylesterase